MEPKPEWGNLLNLGFSSSRKGTVKILVLGDGDLSYSNAISESLSPLSETEVSGMLEFQLFATVLESKERTLEAFEHSQEMIESLSTRENCMILFEVDGTKLHETFDPDTVRFDRIIFNFPQYPPVLKAKNKIQNQRTLLCKCLKSCSQFLTTNQETDGLQNLKPHEFGECKEECEENERSTAVLENCDGQIWITLCSGQGGTHFDTPRREWQNCWQISEAAAQAGLKLVHAQMCDIDALENCGYRCTGRRNTDMSFNMTGSVTHILSRDSLSLFAVFSCHTWIHCASFWVTSSSCVPPTSNSPSGSSAVSKEFEEQFADFVRNFCDERNVYVEINLLEVWTHSETLRVSKCYQFSYFSRIVQLSRIKAHNLNTELCQTISDTSHWGMELR